MPIYVEFQKNSSKIQVLQCYKAPNVCIRVVYTVKNVKNKRGDTTIIQFNSCMNRACTVAHAKNTIKDDERMKTEYNRYGKSINV